MCTLSGGVVRCNPFLKVVEKEILKRTVLGSDLKGISLWETRKCWPRKPRPVVLARFLEKAAKNHISRTTNTKSTPSQIVIQLFFACIYPKLQNGLKDKRELTCLGLPALGWDTPRDLGKAGFGEQGGLKQGHDATEPTPEAVVSSRGTELCSLEISANLGRTPGPTWRLAALWMSHAWHQCIWHPQIRAPARSVPDDRKIKHSYQR